MILELRVRPQSDHWIWQWYRYSWRPKVKRSSSWVAERHQHKKWLTY